jgi:hypothetical protein
MITKSVIRLYADTSAPYFQRSRAEQDYMFADLDSIGKAFAKEPSSWGADGLVFTNDFDDLTWEVTQDDTHIVIEYSYIKAEYEGEQERTEGTLAYLYSQYTLQITELALLTWVDSYTVSA